jgi:hypothetical protein
LEQLPLLLLLLYPSGSLALCAAKIFLDPMTERDTTARRTILAEKSQFASTVKRHFRGNFFFSPVPIYLT